MVLTKGLSVVIHSHLIPLNLMVVVKSLYLSLYWGLPLKMHILYLPLSGYMVFYVQTIYI